MIKINTKEAFYWMIGILRKHKIPFQISGGLAARVYGARRKLADIDIDISEKYFKILMQDIKEHIKAGPNRYRDKNWDLYSMTLKYKGQEIDLCGRDNMKIFDYHKRKWVRLRSDFSQRTMKHLYGLKVPVESKDELLAYKRKLWRRVDRIDVKQIDNIN